MEKVYCLTLHEPFTQYTVHAHSKSQINRALGRAMVELRNATIRQYGVDEHRVNSHSTLRDPGASMHLRMRTMEESFRRPDCLACSALSNDQASKGKLREHKLLNWHLFGGDAIDAYRVTLQNPFQEVTVRANYQSYVDMFLKPLEEIRHPKIRKYEPEERPVRRYCDLRSGNSEVYREACQNLAIFLAEGSLRASGCKFCLGKC